MDKIKRSGANAHRHTYWVDKIPLSVSNRRNNIIFSKLKCKQHEYIIKLNILCSMLVIKHLQYIYMINAFSYMSMRSKHEIYHITIFFLSAFTWYRPTQRRERENNKRVSQFSTCKIYYSTTFITIYQLLHYDRLWIRIYAWISLMKLIKTIYIITLIFLYKIKKPLIYLLIDCSM